MRFGLFPTLIGLFICCVAIACAQGGGLPEPSREDQDKALKVVKETFHDQYRAKTADDRLSLSQKLIATAMQEGDDPATRYVMLTEARELAISAGDLTTIKSSIGSLASLFAVNEPAMMLEAIQAAAGRVTDPKQAAEISKALLTHVDDALATADIDSAFSCATKAEQAARRSESDELVLRVTRRAKDVRALKTQYSALQAAKVKLATSADDAVANTLIGKYFCFGTSNWEAGLAHLAKGDDASLRKAAELDLNTIADTKERASVGDSWNAIAEKLDPIAKEHARQRALAAYEQSLAVQTGLQKLRVQQQMAALREALAIAIDKKAGEEKKTAGAKAKESDPLFRAFAALIKGAAPKARQEPRHDILPGPFSQYLDAQLPRFPAVDETLTVTNVSALGSDYVEAHFEALGPVTVDGVDYMFAPVILTQDPALSAALKPLQPGTQVELKANVRFFQIWPVSNAKPGENPVARLDGTFDSGTITIKRPKGADKKGK